MSDLSDFCWSVASSIDTQAEKLQNQMEQDYDMGYTAQRKSFADLKLGGAGALLTKLSGQVRSFIYLLKFQYLNADDVLINNQAADEELQNFEVSHVHNREMVLSKSPILMMRALPLPLPPWL